VVGKHTRDLFPAETAERFLADDDQVIRLGEAIINRHERVVQANGGVRWLSTTKVPLRNEQGRTIGLVGIGRDITQRKEGEEKLAQYTRELQQKNAEMEDDLNMAREVQLAFLPQQFPTFPAHVAPEESALRFYSRYLPATLLGGDFFHVGAIDETSAGVLICDVMGHGVRAALVTAIHRALMEELSDYAAEPGAFLDQMNRALLSILRRTRSPMFASALYLTIDASTGLLRCANAGHPRPLHVRRRDGVVELLGHSNQRPGPALGLFDGTTYPVQEFRVAEGDLIVLFTDGLYEVENAHGELYDQHLLTKAIETRAALPTETIFDETVDEVLRFSATRTFSDDVCLVGIEVCRLGASKQP
jgi:sigma-B regulation protein RsbU (phosphoserine phosphatase)